MEDRKKGWGFGWLLLGMLLLGMLLLVGGCALADTSEGYVYAVEDDQAHITAYAGTETDLVIPQTLGGYPTVVIGKRAFEGNTTLKSVVVPQGVTTMEKGVFAGCTALESVSLPSTLQAVPDEAFEGCTALTDVSLASEIRRVRDRAFYGCSALQSIVLPSNCKAVGEMAFAECTSLLDVTLPHINTYCTYGRKAFENTPWLRRSGTDFATVTASFGQQVLIRYLGSEEEVTVPSGIYAVEGAFDGNENVTKVTLPMNCTRINAYGFADCVNLREIVATHRLYKTAEYAFLNCRSLTSFPYYNTKTQYILRGTFEGCESLVDIPLPDSILTIEKDAFRGCKSLTDVRLPNRLTLVEQRVFEDCAALENIEFPQTLETIEARAFADCVSLEVVSLPEYLTTIEEEAFSGCLNLKSVLIPRRVVEIGENAFAGCEDVVLSVVHESYGEAYAIQHGIAYEYYNEFARSYQYSMNDDGVIIELYSGDERNMSVPRRIVGEPVAAIGKAAFQNNQALETVVLPDSVLSIDEWAFSYCESLRSVSLPDGLRSIGADAFSGCMALETINLPASLTFIGERAFKDCPGVNARVAVGSYALTYVQENDIPYVIE